MGGTFKRFLHTVTHRPLKVVSAAFGIGALGEVVLGGSSTGDGINIVGHAMLAMNAAKSGSAADLSWNSQAMLRDIGAGALNGSWVAPAAGAVVTGILSRVFRI